MTSLDQLREQIEKFPVKDAFYTKWDAIDNFYREVKSLRSNIFLTSFNETDFDRRMKEMFNQILGK